MKLIQKPDLSIFTCEPKRVHFYTIGGWQVSKNACLIGGTLQNPFRSDSLGLVTMIKFISEKGVGHKEDFENSDIFLELGEDSYGKFILEKSLNSVTYLCFFVSSVSLLYCNNCNAKKISRFFLIPLDIR